MKNSHLSIISLVIILLASCVGSSENDDREQPIITDIRLTSSAMLGDTIMNGEDSILLNRNPYATIDTLIIGKSMFFSARFTDNDKLSSFRLNLDSVELAADPERIDRAYTYWQRYTSIFGKDTITISKQRFGTIPDSIAVDTKNLKLREGDYYVRVMCVDVAGNQTDTLKYSRDVKLFYRETLINSLHK